MQVNISGLHIELGGSLQEYVRENIVSKVQKYFDHPTHADIRFDKHGSFFHVEILVSDGTGSKSFSKAHADNEDVYKAFDECLGKIAWQLNKYKDKLKDLHRRRLASERYMIEAMDYVINPSDDVEDEVQIQEQQAIESHPVVIAETKMHIERMSVKDAVMQLELMNLSALAFINDGSGRINFVYTRSDGNISWVDAEKLKMEG